MCYSKKELKEFETMEIDEREKIMKIEEHLDSCPKCLMNYNLTRAELSVDSYVKQIKEEEEDIDCLSSERLKRHAEGETEEDEVGRINKHLFRCNECKKKFLNLTIFSQDVEEISSFLPESVATDLAFTMEINLSGIRSSGRIRSSKSLEEHSKKESVDHFVEGEKIEVKFSIPETGYLTVIHYDSEGKGELVFPNCEDRDNFVKKGERKPIGVLRVTPPFGESCFKAFLSVNQLINPEDIKFTDEEANRKLFEEFLEKFEKEPGNKWKDERRYYVEKR